MKRTKFIENLQAETKKKKLSTAPRYEGLLIGYQNNPINKSEKARKPREPRKAFQTLKASDVK